MKRRGIELVEVLVVIAILGVLAGLLIPAVMAARDYSKTQDVKQTTSHVVVEPLWYDGKTSIIVYKVTIDGEVYYLAASSGSPLIQLRSDKVLKLEKE